MLHNAFALARVSLTLHAQFFVQMTSHCIGSSLGPHPLIPSHASFACVIWCVVSDLSIRQFHSLLPHHLLSDHPVLPSARQLHLPGCGGQTPCVLPLRTLAPWPRTSLPQVMSPTTTSSQRLMSNTPRSPRASTGSLMTSTTMTSPSVRPSLMRAEDEPITLKKKAYRPICRSVMIEPGDLNSPGATKRADSRLTVKRRLENTNYRLIITEEVYKH